MSIGACRHVDYLTSLDPGFREHKKEQKKNINIIQNLSHYKRIKPDTFTVINQQYDDQGNDTILDAAHLCNTVLMIEDKVSLITNNTQNEICILCNPITRCRLTAQAVATQLGATLRVFETRKSFRMEVLPKEFHKYFTIEALSPAVQTVLKKEKQTKFQGDIERCWDYYDDIIQYALTNAIQHNPELFYQTFLTNKESKLLVIQQPELFPIVGGIVQIPQLLSPESLAYVQSAKTIYKYNNTESVESLLRSASCGGTGYGSFFYPKNEKLGVEISVGYGTIQEPTEDYYLDGGQRIQQEAQVQQEPEDDD